MSVDSADIAIVGGGLMGATLALILGRALPSCRLVLFDKNTLQVSQAEQLSQPSFDGRSTALSPTTVDLFKSLDLWSAIHLDSAAIKNIHVSDKGQSGWVKLETQDNRNAPLGYVIENRLLGWALSEALVRQQNVTVRAPALVDRVQIQQEGALLHCQHTGNLLAGLVVVADGAESPLRSQLGIAVWERDYRQVAVVANVECSAAHQGNAYERFTSSGPLALLPLAGAGNRLSMVWSWPQIHATQALTLNDADFLQRLQATFGYRTGCFTRIGQRKAYPLKLIQAREQARSHVLLMGNAAHFLHPVAGQGFNLAVRDGLRLAQVLSQADRKDLGRLDTLQKYGSLQHGDQLRTVWLSDGFNRLFSSRGPLKKAVRTAGMLGIQHVPWMRSMFIEQMSGRSFPKAKVRGEQ